MNSPQFYSFIEKSVFVYKPCSAAFPRFVHKLQQKTDASGCTAVERPFDLLCRERLWIPFHVSGCSLYSRMASAVMPY